MRHLSLSLIVLAAVVTIGTVVTWLAVRLAIGAQRTRVGTGVEGLANEIGTVARELTPEEREIRRRALLIPR